MSPPAGSSTATLTTSPTTPNSAMNGNQHQHHLDTNGGDGSADHHHQQEGAQQDQPPEEDYKPKNILVTGGAGFIGSHVVILLATKYPNYKIVNMDRLDYCSCLDNLEEVKRYRNYKFLRGNICSSDLVNFVLEEEEIDTILHFAAQTHVDNSFGNSFSFTQNNILGTHVLLESAKVHKIKRFIHVSTDEVYGEGTHDQAPMFEDHLLEPTNPYAATKAGAEFLAKSYSRSFNLPLIITRGNNVYGPHQYPEKLVPKFINLLMRNRTLPIHGSGLNTRNFMYVSDVAQAFDTILHKGHTGKIYNIGGTHEKANIDVAKDLIRLMKGDAHTHTQTHTQSTEGETNTHTLTQLQERYIKHVPDRAFNDLRYTINSEALHKLGWKEETSWEEGLEKTIQWYRQYSAERYGDCESALVPHPCPHLSSSTNLSDRGQGDVVL